MLPNLVSIEIQEPAGFLGCSAPKQRKFIDRWLLAFESILLHALSGQKLEEVIFECSMHEFATLISIFRVAMLQLQRLDLLAKLHVDLDIDIPEGEHFGHSFTTISG